MTAPGSPAGRHSPGCGPSRACSRRGARARSLAEPVMLSVAGRTDAGVHALGPGGELLRAAGGGAPERLAAASLNGRATARRGGAWRGAGSGRLRCSPRRALAHATAIGCWRAGAQPVRARPGAVVAARRSTRSRCGECAGLLAGHARLHRVHARPRPTTSASSATCSRARWVARRRPARVLDRGRHLHAPHGPGAGRDDARGGGRPAPPSSDFAALLEGAPRAQAGRDRRAARPLPGPSGTKA